MSLASQVASASGFDVQQSNSYLRQPHARHTSGHPVASFGCDFVKETTCVFLPSPAILVCSSLFSSLALLEARPPSVPVEHLAHCDALSRTMFPISAFLCVFGHHRATARLAPCRCVRSLKTVLVMLDIWQGGRPPWWTNTDTSPTRDQLHLRTRDGHNFCSLGRPPSLHFLTERIAMTPPLVAADSRY